MTEEKKITVKVSDKRLRPLDDTDAPTVGELDARAEGLVQVPEPHSPEADPGSEAETDMPEAESDSPAGEPDASIDVPAPGPGRETNRDYLEDLLRVQAEFENTRKRLEREKNDVAARATASFVSKLLPVLDNLGRAVSHGEVDAGVELVHKELVEILASEGLEEIEALGRPFDPTVHDGVDAREEASVDEPTCVEVYRPGYRFKGTTIRPAMVVVGRPAEPESAELLEASQGETPNPQNIAED